MSMKKIINKNEKVWFHSSKKTSFIPEKEINLKYNFREARWNKGVILDGIVNETSREITRAQNKTFTDLSLTKTDDNEWGKRKIINSIKVKIEKNIEDVYDDAISFSLVQVKKSIFTDNSVGSHVSDKRYCCENQLITSPDKNLFSNSFEFNERFYDLADHEDFALIQDIEFRNNFLTTGKKKCSSYKTLCEL